MMDREEIKRLAADPRFITGIYNYCDRWCERCPFTSRCMNFTMTEKQFSDPESRDIQNKAFWNKLGEVFQTTLEMVKEMAAATPRLTYEFVNVEENRALAAANGVVVSERTVVPAIVRDEGGTVLFGIQDLQLRLLKLLGVGS